MGDINTTVECYAALRCSGFKPEEEPLKRARAWILSQGGLKKTRNFTRIWLALIGEWPWEFTPVVPPAWIYSLMALHVEGYPLDHPVLRSGLEAWNHHWSYERDGATYLQASESPIWDTLLTLQGLLDCEASAESFPQMVPALEWILQKQILVKGDWAMTVKGVECGGWAFERANRLYPDLDDTAVALTVLVQLRDRVPRSFRPRIEAAIGRAETWVRAMQCSNGGWAAFDEDNDAGAPLYDQLQPLPPLLPLAGPGACPTALAHLGLRAYPTAFSLAPSDGRGSG